MIRGVGWGGGEGDGVDLYKTIMKSCMIRFSKLLITNIDFFSSTRGCSLEGGRGGGSWLQMKRLQVKSCLINIIEYR